LTQLFETFILTYGYPAHSAAQRELDTIHSPNRFRMLNAIRINCLFPDFVLERTHCFGNSIYFRPRLQGTNCLFV